MLEELDTLHPYYSVSTADVILSDSAEVLTFCEESGSERDGRF